MVLIYFKFKSSFLQSWYIKIEYIGNDSICKLIHRENLKIMPKFVNVDIELIILKVKNLLIDICILLENGMIKIKLATKNQTRWSHK